MNKELEEAIKELRILSLLGLGCNITEEIKQKFKTILNYIDNSISKEVVEEKLKKLEKQYEIVLDENSTKAFILKCQIEIVKEIVNLQSNKQPQ